MNFPTLSSSLKLTFFNAIMYSGMVVADWACSCRICSSSSASHLMQVHSIKLFLSSVVQPLVALLNADSVKFCWQQEWKSFGKQTDLHVCILCFCVWHLRRLGTWPVFWLLMLAWSLRKLAGS